MVQVKFLNVNLLFVSGYCYNSKEVLFSQKNMTIMVAAEKSRGRS